jgi:hypothetical protein
VTDYSSKEAAERAGISEDELARLVELGILHLAEADRYSSGDVRKAALIHGMTEAEPPLEGLASITASGAISLTMDDGV